MISHLGFFPENVRDNLLHPQDFDRKETLLSDNLGNFRTSNIDLFVRLASYKDE